MCAGSGGGDGAAGTALAASTGGVRLVWRPGFRQSVDASVATEDDAARQVRGCEPLVPGRTVQWHVRLTPTSFAPCAVQLFVEFMHEAVEEEDGGYGRDMRIERATFESRTNAAVFEFLPKGTSLFGETKTWRKNEKKESEKDDLKSNAMIRIGQNKEEEEEKREEMNVNEESTVFLRKRLPFFAASFDEFGERAGREAYSSARKALEDFFSSEAMKMFKNRKSETTRDDETAVRTTNPIDSKTKVLSVNAQQELIDKEIFTELEHEALRLEIEQASRQITENCQTVLAQIDANKKHFQRRALKDRAESAYKSMQKAKLVLDKTKVDKEKERDAASRENVMEKVRAEKEERRAPRVGKDLAAPPAALASGSSQHLDDLSSAFRKTRVVFEACRRRCDRVACASGVASGDGVRKYDDAATLKREGNI